MARPYRYLHYDVFTDRPFAGNQLAVLPDARGLSGLEMQQIAAEMAFSETTFVLPAERDDTDARMRIFTPKAELPLAGHPTVGSTFALARDGVIVPGRSSFTFGLGVGPTPVELSWEDEELAFAWMTQPVPEFGPAVSDAREVAPILGVDGADLPPSEPAAQIVSCGVPMFFVQLTNRAVVDRCALDRAALCRLLTTLDSEEIPVFVFALDSTGSTAEPAGAYCRMFAPTFGIEEDPATGGASGPLGGYLVQHGLVGRRDRTEILNRQGIAMGRPSSIHIAIESSGEAITRVQVGGEAVLVAEGTLFA